MRQQPHWVIDKHIPLALLGAIALQSGAALWWAASISSRVDVLERQATTSAPMSERLVRLETKFDGVVDSLVEIKNILRQTPSRQQP